MSIMSSDQRNETSLQEARRAFTRKHVCDAARDLFYRQGYEATTFEQIAKAAGTRRTTLYSHFRDKEDILEAISDEYHAGLCALVDRLPGPAPSREEIDTWIASLVDFVKRERAPATLVIGLGTGTGHHDTILRSSKGFLSALAQRSPAFKKAMGSDPDDRMVNAWAKVVLRELSFACLAAARDGDQSAEAITVAAELFERFVHEFA